MSIELETARQQLAAGDLKKALRTLWLVEAKARADFDEARGLVEVAKKLSESSDGKVRKDAELLKEWRLQASSTRCQRARTSTRSSGSRHELASFSFTQALSRRRHSGWSYRRSSHGCAARTEHRASPTATRSTA